jgi:hypothetical protein
MVRQCLESKAEILFDPDALKNIGINLLSTDDEIKYEAPIDHDRNDAVCEPHSPFKGMNGWWVLELIPMRRNFPPIEDGKIVQGKKWKRKIQYDPLHILSLNGVFSTHFAEPIYLEAVTYGRRKQASMFTLLSKFAWTIQRQIMNQGLNCQIKLTGSIEVWSAY